MKLFKLLPVQLILCLLLAAAIGPFVQPQFAAFAYTLSRVFVEALLFLLPFMVIVYLSNSLMGFNRKAPLLVLVLFILVTASNLCALWTAYGVGSFVLPSLPLSIAHMSHSSCPSTLKPLWDASLPRLLTTDKALLTGMLLGFLMVYLPSSNMKTKSVSALSSCQNAINWGLQKIFIPLLPFYVFGFALKMSVEGSLSFLAKHYTPVFVLICILTMVYMTALYLLAACSSKRRLKDVVKAMLPAGITGFSTMSSAVTLPISIKGVIENTQDPQFTQVVVPGTSNIHMLGDDISVTLTAMSLMMMMGWQLPDLTTFAAYSIAFSIAKLGCVGVPGASVLVVLPVIEQHFGFTPTLVSLVTTIYILQDPIGTMSNVMGNGAFAIISHKIWNKLSSIGKNTAARLT